MDEVLDFEVCVFEGKRSWYELLLSAVFFGVFFYLLILSFYVTFIDLSLILFIKRLALTIGIGGYCFIKGLQFSATKNMLIDVDSNLIISRYIVGPFSYDSKINADEFEYVSFFKNRDDSYGTSLWYKLNRHFKMYSFENKDAAYNFSLEIANKLNIDILDATEQGNSIWIDKLNS